MRKPSGSLIPSWYLERRYAILFYSLLVTIAAGPLIDAVGFGGVALNLLLGANMLAAVVPIGNRLGRQVLLGLFSVAVVVRLAAWWLGLPAVSISGLGGWTVIALLAAVSALRFSLKSPVVTSEHLHAALSAYLLAGVFFGIGYWILENTWPGSLSVAGGDPGPDFSPVNSIYFSFVTLATLGYGDIVPRTDAARGLAITEAVIGQLYLAVMVARLVSSYVAKRKE